jgi:hypothetical protein
MTSHKEICKQLKEKDKVEKKNSLTDQNQEKKVANTEAIMKKSTSNAIVASDFLKKRMHEITSSSSKQTKTNENSQNNNNNNKNNSAFDLELYIGDSVTTKKLLDVNSKYINFSPQTATSAAYKRKHDELTGKLNESKSPGTHSTNLNESVDEKKAKKLKMIEDLLKIKSNHTKEANDPEKNTQLKSYFDK